MSRPARAKLVLPTFLRVTLAVIWSPTPTRVVDKRKGDVTTMLRADAALWLAAGTACAGETAFATATGVRRALAASAAGTGCVAAGALWAILTSELVASKSVPAIR
jgi:hypothetical protein